MDKKEYTLTEISNLSGIPPSKLRNLIRRGYVKAKLKKVPIERPHTVSYGKGFSKKRQVIIKTILYTHTINIDDWLSIPAFIRENWKRESQERGK